MNLSLLTDLYQLLMASAYYKEGIHNQEAVFHLFFRKRPFNGGFTVAAGLEAVIKFIESFHYDDSDLSYLASLKDDAGNPFFEVEFLDYLRNFKFTLDIEAVPEGTVVFPHEPLLRVKGPLLQAQLLESPLLNLMNFSTLIATKAARIRIAAENDAVLEFGLRRAQGIDGALTASRSAYVGGCNATSNLLAGKIYGIPVKGTHSHSWVMVFDEELESFKSYARSLPGNSVFLVDTYDTIEGVKKAIEVGEWLKSKGHKFLGVRLDSGDLTYFSQKARVLLDEAGFKDAKIVASNELDENVISELKRQGAQINVWGVGTHLVTAANQPALDGVYKLSMIKDKEGHWQDRIKLSEQTIKISTPGILQVRRFSKGGEHVADMIYDTLSLPDPQWSISDPVDSIRQKKIPLDASYEDLLVPIYKNGRKVYDMPTLNEIRERSQTELFKFHAGIKRFLNPHQYVVGLEKCLYDRKMQLIQSIRNK